MLNTDFISTDDFHLTAFIEERSQQSMDFFYDKYSPALYGTIYRITNDTHLAKECLLATFVKAWNETAAFQRSGRSLFTWLLHMARQAAFNAMVREKEKITIYHTFETSYRQHYSAFELVFFKGLSCKQAAELSGLTLMEIKNQVRMDLNIRKIKRTKHDQ